MDVVKIIAPKTLGALLLKEYDPDFCRESVTVLAGSGAVRPVRQFAVVAKVDLGAATVTAGACVSGTGGTAGDGAIGTVTADAGAQEGDYEQVFIEPTANLGTFELFRPDGTLDGTGVVGTAYNGMLNFTQADGANDFVAGDRRTINVDYAAGSGKYVEVDLAATDGKQTTVGINLFEAEAPDGTDTVTTILKRGPAIYDANELVYPAGATTDQKTAIRAALAALNPPIIARVTG
ncbi:MAG: head decoration protein [Caulobacter sp.]|nr:head decoration protein [Caulobacter sp.]